MNRTNISQSFIKVKRLPRIGYMYSKEARQFANQLINLYAEPKNSKMHLFIEDVPDLEQDVFAAILLRNNDINDSEATGTDNPQYDSDMMPALIKYLSDITNKDYEIEFLNEWRRGVINYAMEIMQIIIDEQLAE